MIEPVPSPCIRRCTLDDNDVCIGCGRHVDEICEWGMASEARRREILELAERRRALRPPFFNGLDS